MNGAVWRTPPRTPFDHAPHPKRMTPFVFVHVGAGLFSPKDVKSHLDACREACVTGLASLLKTQNNDNVDNNAVSSQHLASDSIAACVAAVANLEDNPHTNAGTGSNLSLGGHVEADASIMEGATGRFGAVGAVSGIKNPVKAAARISALSGDDGYMPDHVRTAPMLLVGKGAFEMAKNAGLEVFTRKRKREEGGEDETGAEEADDDEHITEKSRKSWNSAMRRYLEGLSSGRPSSNEEGDDEEDEEEDSRPADTVGAISCTSNGNLSSAVSSGGPMLKVSGRIGHASIYGAGTWARDAGNEPFGVAVSTSGRGEQIMRTFLAKELGTAMLRASSREENEEDEPLPTELLETAFRRCFLDSPEIPRGIDRKEREAGAILARIPSNTNDPIELYCIHSTPSMIVGYFAKGMPAPTVKHSVKDPGKDLAVSMWSLR